MKFILTREAGEFAARTQAFLAQRIERNVIATVLMIVLDGVHAATPPWFAYGVDERDEVRFAALRTPPWYLLATELDQPGDDAERLVKLWLAEDPELPGVNALPATARQIASAWARLTGGSSRCRMREAMHALDEVLEPPYPGSGRLRLARADDRPLLIEWTRAFAEEAGVVAGEVEAMVDGRLRRNGMFFWEDGLPVSMVGIAPELAGVVRVGPVYTPPQFRRRGYAGHAVAATSRRALADGARQCMLFTDLANPTSNKIYAEIGYRRFADWEEHAFYASSTNVTALGSSR